MAKFGLIICICFVMVFQSNAQSSVDDKLTINAPTDKFVSIELQAHKGFPRLGVVNTNQGQVSGQRQGIRTVSPVRGKKNPEVLENSKVVFSGKNNFSLLVSLKYLAPFMGDLDRERLTTLTSGMSEKESNSALLQRFLRSNIAPNLCLTDECRNANQGKNEFERLRNYKNFVNNCLDPLLKWSQQLMQNDQLVGYHVSVLQIGNNYDFDKKGYWVYHSLVPNDIFPIKQGVIKKVMYKPVQPFEVALQNKLGKSKNIGFFLSMDEQTAERLQHEGVRRLYVVKKIKVERSSTPMNAVSEVIEFNFSHENADLEIYMDEALKKHFISTSLSNLTLKTN